MDIYTTLPWLILIVPLISAILIQLFFRKFRQLSLNISVGAVAFAFLASLVVFFGSDSTSPNEFSWIDLPGLRIPIGLTIDYLSKAMLLIVTGVGTLVHIYSLVYMKDDDGSPRFFGNLSFFIFSMLGIVLANNFAMMFIFWELVGVSSYLLVGHWHTRDTASAAANKAFLTNRIGDFGFRLGILMVWSVVGSVVFADIQGKISLLTVHPLFLTTAVLLIFCGAVGKSAQMPLHVWLPDAMEGPTPVSALIHAATMVAAGVYMLARVSFLIEPSLTAQGVIATIGAVTCFFAALMATQQDDIKRILAYSTLSQLGYMILAVGVAAPGAAMFHLFTHACFKALLFLGAGAIIHQLHHEQGIWKMGGLRHRMRWTFWAFTAGYLALTGCPGFSGSFSKDEILYAAYDRSLWFFLPGVFTVFLTAFYMTRLYVVVFFGKERSDAAKHGHDGPPAMTTPLLILAFFAVFAGYGTAHYFLGDHEPKHHGIVEILAIGFFLSGTGFAWFLYRDREKEFISIPLFKNKFYIDEIYAALIAGTQDLLAVTSAWFDKWILDGLIVRGLSSTTWGVGFVLRFLQVGNLQAYALLFGLGVIGLIYLVVFTK